MCERSFLVATRGAMCGPLLATTSHPGSAFLASIVYVGVDGGGNHSAVVVLERKPSSCALCLAPWSALGLICTFYGVLTPKSTWLLLLHVRTPQVKCQDFHVTPK